MAPPGQRIWDFSPLQAQRHIISMSEQNSPAHSKNLCEGTNKSPFRGGQGIGRYFATPADLERQFALISQRNIPSNPHEAAGHMLDYQGQLHTSSSVHESPYTVLRPGQPRMLSPPPGLNEGPSTPYQTFSSAIDAYRAGSQGRGQSPSAPSFQGGSQHGPPEQCMAQQAHHPELAELPVDSRKRYADRLEENDTMNHFLSATAIPAPLPKNQRRKSNKPPATTTAQATGEFSTVDLASAHEKRTSAPKQPCVATAGQNGDHPELLAELPPTTPAPDSPIYRLSDPFQGLRKVLGEPRWQQFLQLVEQYVGETIDEPRLIHGQRRIFHGQNPMVEKKCRRLTENMVREAREAQGGM
ncbi:hypothetical protein DPSP01_006133 [Paraphaeosphaeria sporulosa]